MDAKQIENLTAQLPKTQLDDVPTDHYIFYLTTCGPAVLRRVECTRGPEAEFGFFYLSRAKLGHRANYKFISSNPLKCVDTRLAGSHQVLMGSRDDILKLIHATTKDLVKGRPRSTALHNWRFENFPAWGTLRMWKLSDK